MLGPALRRTTLLHRNRHQPGGLHIALSAYPSISCSKTRLHKASSNLHYTIGRSTTIQAAAMSSKAQPPVQNAQNPSSKSVAPLLMSAKEVKPLVDNGSVIPLDASWFLGKPDQGRIGFQHATLPVSQVLHRGARARHCA
jgi:hypothetical protein